MVDFLVTYEGSHEQIGNDEVTDEKAAHWQNCGKGWSDMMFASYRLRRQGIKLRRLSIRVGWTSGSDSLVTLVGDGPDGSVVAFHGAENPQIMWARLTKRMFADQLTWKEDQYER